MIKSFKHVMIMWIRNRNRQRFTKMLDKADNRIARVKDGDKYLLELRKQLTVEPWRKP